MKNAIVREYNLTKPGNDAYFSPHPEVASNFIANYALSIRKIRCVCAELGIDLIGDHMHRGTFTIKGAADSIQQLIERLTADGFCNPKLPSINASDALPDEADTLIPAHSAQTSESEMPPV